MPSASKPSDAPPTRLSRLRRRRRSRPVTAFVLSGGASLGAMQAGMLHALYEAGITPDLIVGTSAGALNGGFIATRSPTPQTTEALAKVWTGLHRDTLFPLRPLGLVTGLSGHRDHLMSDDGVRRLIAEHLEVELLEDMAIPLHITAYDILTGEDVRLSTGPALDAILAASSIPGVYPPVEIGDHLLGDGGVVNNTPLSHAVELGATRIYVLPTLAPVRQPVARPKGALDAAVNAITMLINGRLHEDIERYEHEVDITVLPATNEHRIQPTDFSRAAEMIEEALVASRNALAVPAEGALAS